MGYMNFSSQHPKKSLYCTKSPGSHSHEDLRFNIDRTKSNKSRFCRILGERITNSAIPPESKNVPLYYGSWLMMSCSTINFQ